MAPRKGIHEHSVARPEHFFQEELISEQPPSAAAMQTLYDLLKGYPPPGLQVSDFARAECSFQGEPKAHGFHTLKLSFRIALSA